MSGWQQLGAFCWHFVDQYACVERQAQQLNNNSISYALRSYPACM